MPITGCLAFLACCGLGTVQGQQLSQGAAGQKIRHVVYDVKHGASQDLAELLAKLYKGESGVQALAAPAGNALVLSAPASAMDDILELLRKLDRRPRVVTIEVLIAEVPRRQGEAGKPAPVKELDERAFTGNADTVVAKLQELHKQGLIGELKRFRLTAAENQRGSVQAGASQPFTTGAAGGGKFATRTIQYRNVGTLIRATPQFGEGNKIVLDLHLSEARMRRVEDGAPADQAPEFISATFEGKVTVAAGAAVAATGVRTQSASGQHQTLVIVTARLQEPESKPGK